MWLGDASVPNALSRVTFPTGLQIEYTYEWLDPAEQTLIPGVQPALSRMTIKPGGPGSPTDVHFRFEQGYFDGTTQEFRGFGKATVSYPTSDDGKNRSNSIFFHQGASAEPRNDDFDVPVAVMKGRPYLSRVTDNDGQILSDSILTYMQRTEGGSIFLAPQVIDVAQFHPDNFCDPTSAKYRDRYVEIARRPSRAELNNSWRRARELGLKFETSTFERCSI